MCVASGQAMITQLNSDSAVQRVQLHGLGENTAVVEEEMMADLLPDLTTGSQRPMVLCPRASLDAEGSQPPATIPEGHDSLAGPMLLPPFLP